VEEMNFDDVVIPDRLPRLERGQHWEGSGKACVMEAASWLAGEPWSDHPRCVHATITRVAIRANDRLNDEDRQRLWPLVLASVGTAKPFDVRLDFRLRVAAFRARRRSLGLVDVWRALLVEYGQRSRDPVWNEAVGRLEYLACYLADYRSSPWKSAPPRRSPGTDGHAGASQPGG
jgi:hypothetical protein